MEDMIAKYRGNYIAEMRKDVGHAPLMVTSCRVIIENDKGEILLQKRRDNGCWALIGGSMEIFVMEQVSFLRQLCVQWRNSK